MKRVEIAVFLIATSLHGGGLLVARSLPKLLHLEKVFTRPMSMEFETEVELPKIDPPKPKPEDPTVRFDTVDPPDERQASLDTHVERNPTRRSRGSRGDASSSGSETGATGPGPQMTTDGDGEWSAPGDGDGDGNPTAPGIGNISSLTAGIAIRDSKAPAAETKAPKAKKADRRIADKILKDEIRKKDKALGLDLPAAGTIASIIKSAVIGSDAPAEAAATFQVVLGPGGKVVSVTAGASRGGSKATWDAIAAMVKGALKAQTLTLTEDFAKGAIVVVNVTSKMKMPSGADVGAGLKLSLTQNFDVADIGAKPVRVVVAPFTATPVQ